MGVSANSFLVIEPPYGSLTSYLGEVMGLDKSLCNLIEALAEGTIDDGCTVFGDIDALASVLSHFCAGPGAISRLFLKASRLRRQGSPLYIQLFSDSENSLLTLQASALNPIQGGIESLCSERIPLETFTERATMDGVRRIVHKVNAIENACLARYVLGHGAGIVLAAPSLGVKEHFNLGVEIPADAQFLILSRRDENLRALERCLPVSNTHLRAITVEDRCGSLFVLADETCVELLDNNAWAAFEAQNPLLARAKILLIGDSLQHLKSTKAKSAAVFGWDVPLTVFARFIDEAGQSVQRLRDVALNDEDIVVDAIRTQMQRLIYERSELRARASRQGWTETRLRQELLKIRVSIASIADIVGNELDIKTDGPDGGADALDKHLRRRGLTPPGILIDRELEKVLKALVSDPQIDARAAADAVGRSVSGLKEWMRRKDWAVPSHWRAARRRSKRRT